MSSAYLSMGHETCRFLQSAVYRENNKGERTVPTGVITLCTSLQIAQPLTAVLGVSSPARFWTPKIWTWIQRFSKVETLMLILCHLKYESDGRYFVRGEMELDMFPLLTQFTLPPPSSPGELFRRQQLATVFWFSEKYNKTRWFCGNSLLSFVRFDQVWSCCGIWKFLNSNNPWR